MHWKSIGPAGGYVKSFATDDRGRIYAGGDDSSGVWASDDDGLTWEHATSALVDLCGWHVVCDGDRVIVADHYGRHPIAVSEDRGRSWDSRGHDQPSMRSKQASVVLIDPDDRDRFIIGTGSERMRPGDGVWVSKDAGRSWVQTGFPRSTVNHLIQLDETIFAGVNTPDQSDSDETAGLYWSHDAGTTWEPVPAWPAGAPVTALTLGASGTLYVGTLSSASVLFRSTDKAASFEALPLKDQALWKVVERADGGILAGSFRGGGAVLCSEDDGQTWTTSTGTESTSVMGLGISPATGTVFAGVFANTGAYRSTDGGRTFSNSTHGLIASMPTNITAGPTPGHLYVTMLGAYHLIPEAEVVAVMETKDGGETWQRLGDLPAHGLNLSVHPTAAHRLLAGTFGRGLFLSDDGGTNWSPITSPGVITAATWLADDAILVSRIFDSAPAAPDSFNPYAPAMTSAIERRAADGNWIVVRERTTAHEFHVDGQKVWSSGDDGVHLSRDAGLTWELVRAEPARTMAVDAERVVVDHGPSHLAVSEDDGGTWQTIELPLAPGDNRWLRGILLEDDAIFVGVDGAEWNPDGSGDRKGGFLVSEDRGATWRREEAGMFCTHVWGLTKDASGAVHVATYGGGAFRLSRDAD